MNRIAGCLLAILLLWIPSAVRSQPTVSHMIPAGVRPGQTTEVTIHGAKLDGALNFWSSLPAKFEFVPVEPDKKDVTSRVCKVTLEAGIPVGIGGFVVGNAAGCSDPVFLLVDDLPGITDNGGNHALAQAQAITVPSAVDGACDGTAFDYYKFAAKKDQRISVEVVAARTASALDSVVRLLDTSGREWVLADDDASFGADSRFSFTIPADGEYVVEIRDNQFRAAGRYRLRIGDFPLVSSPYPLGGRLGSTVRFKFTGPAAESAAPVFVRLPDDEFVGGLPIAAKIPSGQSSGMAAIVASRLPDLMETEPNNEFKSATITSLPCAVNGTFHEPSDKDYFQFAATKDQSMFFRAVSRSMGSPSYVAMRLLNADGAPIAEAPINDADETTLSFSFPADGMYGLMVEDLLHRGGPEYGYRVEVQPNEGFTLALKQDNNTRTKFVSPLNGGAFALIVQVARRGYDGAIQLAPEVCSQGFTLLNGRIPEKVNEHRVIVVPPAGAAAGTLHDLRLVGTAVINNREQRVAMQTLATVRAKLPQLPYPPLWLSGLIFHSVAPESPPFFNVVSSVNPVPFSRAQAQTQFNLNLERKNAEFKDNITVFVDNLPAGFAAAVKQEKDVYQVTVTGPKDASNGRRDLQVVTYGEFQGSGRILRLGLPLEVAD